MSAYGSVKQIGVGDQGCNNCTITGTGGTTVVKVWVLKVRLRLMHWLHLFRLLHDFPKSTLHIIYNTVVLVSLAQKYYFFHNSRQKQEQIPSKRNTFSPIQIMWFCWMSMLLGTGQIINLTYQDSVVKCIHLVTPGPIIGPH